MIRREQQVVRSIRAAFTLMEMMVVVAILVVLVGVAVPIYIRYLDDSKVKRARTDVETLTKVVETFYYEHGHYPEHLRELVTPPTGKAYIKQTALLDPWDQEYESSLPNVGQNMAQISGEGPDIFSRGPPGGNQPIGNWTRIK